MLLWVLAVLIGLPLVLPSATLATEILIFAMAALACNLLLGYTGLLSFGQGIFFGAGAYCAALLMIHLQLGLFMALLGAALAGGVLALLVGALAIRRTGIYFVMLTLAFSQMAYFVAYTLSDWTGGDNGLLSVPRPEIRVGDTVLLSLADARAFYGFVAVLFLLIFIGARRVIASPFGSTLMAIRENETRASAIGYDTRHFKILVFVLSGAVTGIAGALYAMLLHFVPLSNRPGDVREHPDHDHRRRHRLAVRLTAGRRLHRAAGRLSLRPVAALADAAGVILILVVIFMRGGLWGGLASLFEKVRGTRKPVVVAKEDGL